MFRTRNGLLEGIFRNIRDEVRPKGWMKQLGGVGNKSFTPEDYQWGGGGWDCGRVNRSEGDRWSLR